MIESKNDANATYAGDFVYDKYETPEVGGKSRIKPQNEWKVFKDHHEAIIDRDAFERIWQSRGTKNVVEHERHPLIGKLECGRCYRSLRIARTKNPYFFCSNRYVTRYARCVRQINVQFLVPSAGGSRQTDRYTARPCKGKR